MRADLVAGNLGPAAFGFSTEAIDYVLDFDIAEKPLWLISIRPWNLSTLGREGETEATPSMTAPDTS